MFFIDDLLTALGPMLAAQGAAAAGAGATSAIPQLIAGSALTSMVPTLMSALPGPGMKAAAGLVGPAATMGASAAPLASMAAPVPMTSALQNAMSLAGGIYSRETPATMAQAASIASPPPTTPPIPEPDAWKQALASGAMVGDAMMRRPLPQPAPAESPRLFVPQGVRPPQVGFQIPRGPSPLERFALALRRM